MSAGSWSCEDGLTWMTQRIQINRYIKRSELVDISTVLIKMMANLVIWPTVRYNRYLRWSFGHQVIYIHMDTGKQQIDLRACQLLSIHRAYIITTQTLSVWPQHLLNRIGTNMTVIEVGNPTQWEFVRSILPLIQVHCHCSLLAKYKRAHESAWLCMNWKLMIKMTSKL